MKRLLVSLLLIGFILPMGNSIAGVLYARRPGTESPVYNLSLSKIATKVDIYGQLAVTHVDEEFYNGNNLTLEGFYAFQLPDGAVIDGLWLWDNGVRKRFIVMKKEEAERIYDSIVNPRQPPRDPAILESLGANRFQLKVFPILPFNSRRIEIQYFHTLPLSLDGTIQYRYPLNLTGYQSVPVERTDMQIEVHTFQRIEELSTSYDANPLLNRVEKITDMNYRISFGLESVLYSQDYVLNFKTEGIYSIFPTLSWDDPDDASADPYFMTWHAFNLQQGTSTMRDIVFVLDASGSMAGDRIATVKGAINGVLPQLSPSDKFRIVLFSSNAISFPSADELLSATPENIAAALEFIQREYITVGSTNYELAFKKGFSAEFRPLAEKKMVFLTDGEPNHGASTYASLMSVITASDQSFVSIYPILFYTNSIQLLYDIAAARGGNTTQVEKGDDLQTVISRIVSNLDITGFTDVAVRYTLGHTYQVFPKQFPDIISSTEFITTGRYNGNGREQVEVAYKDGNGSDGSIVRDVDFQSTLINVKEVGAYWASKRIDELLDQIKIEGAKPELVNGVIELSIKHSILTPYTAFLVLETNEIDPPNAVESVGSVAQSFALQQNYPNPFSLRSSVLTTIPFSVPSGANIRIVICDVLGRVVKILQDGYLTPGQYTVTWDATDVNGVRVVPGTYMIRMSTSDASVVKMLSVVK